MANLGRAHSSWDWTSRKWTGCIASPQENPNTKGCRFETELAGLASKAADLDAKGLALELKHLGGTSITDKEIARAAENAASLADVIKTGNKMVTALSSWMAFDPDGV